MIEVDRLEHESVQSRQSIQELLNSLVDGIEKGRIVLSADNDRTRLIPAELIRVSIKARRKSGKSKLSIKLAWKEPPLEINRKNSDEIKVST